MATEKTTATENPHARLALAHLAINEASSVMGYVLVAERERGNTDLADTLFIANERLVDALSELDEMSRELRALGQATAQ